MKTLRIYNVQLPLSLQGLSRADRRTRLDRLLDEVDPRGLTGLTKVLHSQPAEVSGGERQRMSVLRAIIHDPEVVFADEPCASLDPLNSRLVLQLLLAWQGGRRGLSTGGPEGSPPGSRQTGRVLKAAASTAGRTLLLVSHDLIVATQVASHFVLLHKGRVIGGRTLSAAELPGGPDQISIREVEDMIFYGKPFPR